MNHARIVSFERDSRVSFKLSLVWLIISAVRHGGKKRELYRKNKWRVNRDYFVIVINEAECRDCRRRSRYYQTTYAAPSFKTFNEASDMVVGSFRFSREKGESAIDPANNHGGVIVSVAHIVKLSWLLL